MRKFKFTSAALLAGLCTLLFLACQKDAKTPSVTSNASGGVAGGKVYGKPTLTCAGSTLESIDLTFTAGTNGAPSGFSIHWMPKAQFELGADGISGTADDNTWPSYTTVDANGDPVNAPFCKGSFSGNANMSRYNLTAAGQSVTIRIGDLLMDNGASVSTGCNSDLTCGTEYVFRAFSHGDNKMNKSVFSDNTTCSTSPCPTDADACVHGGLGHWKNTPITSWPQSVQDNGLVVGQNTYTAAELQQILNASSTGNGYLIMAHQLIPALLNQASGADYSANAQGIADAQAYLSGSGSNKLPPIGTATSPASNQATLIAAINRGNHSCP